MNRGGIRGGGSGGSGSGNSRDLIGTIHADLFTRPENFDKRGTSGESVECMANFVPLNTNEHFTIYQYHTVFVPDVDSKSIRQQILSQPSIMSEIGDKFIFDGMILYLTEEWSREQILEARHPITGEAVSVRFKNSVRFGHNDAQAINCYNIVLRRCLDQIGFKQMGRNYFNPSMGTNISQYGLSVWPGYETAIRVYEGGLMLCIENRFKVLRTDNLLNIMYKEFDRAGQNIERMQHKFLEMFQGTSIVTHYNNKLHRCTSVAWDMTPDSEFKKADGTMISLADYYKQQYNLEVTKHNQPIIISEGKPKQPGEPPQQTYLIPEFCQPTGLTDDMRKDFRLMRALSQHTRLDPNARYQSTGQFVHAINTNETCSNLLEAWQLQLGHDLVHLKSRVFPGERLFGKNPTGFVGIKAEWARECKRNGNFLSKDMRNWILVCPSNPTNVSAAQKLAMKFQELGRTLSMTIGDPMCASVTGTTVQDYIRAVKTALDQAKGHEIHMIVILLADDNKTRYDTLKKMLCTVNNGGQPVPSQCVLMKTLVGSGSSGGENKNFDSIVLKILLQINCKMGGALWKVNLPLRKCMLVGYDLYNDSTMRGKTIGACVSTYNDDYTQFYSQTRPHDNPTELGNNLTHFIRKALRKYFTTNNGTLPERVFLYRDGAGDGQIPYIRNQEVNLVKEACQDVVKKAGLTGEIKLSFTIVTKKVNMRVFRRSGDKLENPTPGTVVDDCVTRPERYDFYLVPQFVNQGTVTPVCYNVIFDNTGLTPDQQQKLAFKLCHLYYNWQGTVRVPSLCQYSHKLAFLVAQSIHMEVDESLRDKLFYL